MKLQVITLLLPIALVLNCGAAETSDEWLQSFKTCSKKPAMSLVLSCFKRRDIKIVDLDHKHKITVCLMRPSDEQLDICSRTFDLNRRTWESN